jgi:hypothetical protein
MPASNAHAADLLVIDSRGIDPACLGTVDPRGLLPAAALGKPKRQFDDMPS